MLEAAIEKLDDLRNRMPRAGGLVIAPSIEMAEFFAHLITLVEGEAPIVVHSETPHADSRIAAFREGDMKWLVSVAMVSEGVDIPRLRVLVYLPSARTELAFRQAVGRVVRSFEPGDDTRAYFVMPRLGVFEEYARRVEAEIVAHARIPGPTREKSCSVCRRRNPLGARTCDGCGHEFPAPRPRTKKCPACSADNSMAASACAQCGQNLSSNIVMTLHEAMRDGVIVRGADLAEADARQGEALAPGLRAAILGSGDVNLIRVLRVLPEESLGRLRALLRPDG